MGTGPPDTHKDSVADVAPASPDGVTLDDLVARVSDVMDTQERLRGLLDAVVALASDLSLASVLHRIVTAACQLTGAQYGALGVMGAGPDRRFRELVTHGVDEDRAALMGDLPMDDDGVPYGFPSPHPLLSDFLGVPIRIREKVFGNLYLAGKLPGGAFTDDDEEVVVALAAAAGVVVENARLYEDGERRQRWLEAAADSTAAVLGPMSRHDALLRVAERGREVASADVAAVLMRHDGGRLLVEAVDGIDGEGLLGGRIVTHGTAAGRVLHGGAPIVVDEAMGRGRTAASGFPVRDGWPSLGSMVLLPLRSGGTVTGILLFGWFTVRDQRYRDTDVTLPAAYAEQVTLALLGAEAQSDRGRLALLEDRDRIGRDLHDLVIQRLFAMGLSMQQTSRLQARGTDVGARIAATINDIDATIGDVRRSIVGLGTATSPDDVRVELGATIAMSAPALGFTPQLRTVGAVDTLIPATLRPHLIAVLREALSNVVRHAHATSAQVVVEATEHVVLTVVDNGRGLGPGMRGSGLKNMRERAELLGGTFAVDSRPEGGTVVIWRVPAVVPTH